MPYVIPYRGCALCTQTLQSLLTLPCTLRGLCPNASQLPGVSVAQLVVAHGAPACPVPSARARPQAVPVGPCPTIRCQGNAGPSASAWNVPVVAPVSRYAGADPSSSSQLVLLVSG